MAIAVGTLDPDIYSKYKSFGDVQTAQRNNQLAQQAAQMDLASKANIYKTQVLSAAAGSGNPDVVNSALQHLNESGIDTSDVPTDLPSLTKYTDAARLAQSPLGSLLNAGLKAEGNVAQAATNTGNYNTAAQYAPLGAAIAAKVSGLTGGHPAANLGSQPAATVAAMPASGAIPNPPSSVPLPAQPTDQGSVAIPAKPMQVAAIDGTAPAVNISAAPTQSPNINSQAAIPAFVTPQQLPGETIGAYNDRVKNLFEAYKSSPDYLAATSLISGKNSALGKDQEATNLEAIRGDQTNQKLQPNFQALRNVNPQVPTGSYGIPAGFKEWLSQSMPNSLSNHEWANAGAIWKGVNSQQALNTLQQLVGSGQIKSNRQIVQMIKDGAVVPEDLPDDARLLLVNTMANESQNQATSAKNISAAVNGGQMTPYIQTVPSTGVLPMGAAAQASQQQFNANKGVIPYTTYFGGQ